MEQEEVQETEKIGYLTIDPLEYTVTLDAVSCAEMNSWAFVDLLKQEIVLRPGMRADRAVVSLLHEALHAIWDLTDLNLAYSDENEEDIVKTLAPKIIDFIQQNEDFVQMAMNPVGIVDEWVGNDEG